ncbi:MAG: DUF2029 domain-containing protein [Caulobacteraceae bacterium]|nr:DUF2029 domain-containing protein [Caulobacteraceae bacterium]
MLALDVAFLAVGAVQGAWLIGADGRPLCRDFGAFWAAGQLVGAGQPALAYDLPSLTAVFQRAGAPAACAMPMQYPPVFFLWLRPLAGLGYPVAAGLWIAAGVAAYAAGLALLGGRGAALLAGLAAPAATACVAGGQSALLLAGLAMAGLALLDRRPLVAGVLIGLLAFKPQFGVLIPLALAASGRWRAFAAAACSVAVSYVAAGLAFGWDIYPAFLDAIAAAQQAVLGQGRISWGKVQSTYGLVRALGGGTLLAWALQGVVCLAAAIGVAALWRSRAPFERKAAGLCVAMLAASPYVLIYDLTLAAAAAVWLLAERGARIGPLSAAAIGASLLLPLAHGDTALPLGPLALALLAAVIVARRRVSHPGEGRTAPAAPLTA